MACGSRAPYLPIPTFATNEPVTHGLNGLLGEILKRVFPAMADPTRGTYITRRKRELRPAKRALRLEEIAIKLGGIGLSLRLPSLQARVLSLEVSDYLTANLLSLFWRHGAAHPGEPKDSS